MNGNFDFWIPHDDEKRKELIRNIEQHDADKVFEMGDVDEFYIDDTYTLQVNSRNTVLYGAVSIPITAQYRDLAKEFVKATGLDQSYKADDRGRITLGSEYAGKKVKVAVVDEEATESDGDGE